MSHRFAKQVGVFVLMGICGVALAACGDDSGARRVTAAPEAADMGRALADAMRLGDPDATRVADAAPFVDVRPLADAAGGAIGDASGGATGDASGGATGDASGGATGGAAGGEIAPPECVEDADCDNGAFCDGVERCLRGVCFASPRLPCTDNIACTVNLCDEATDTCAVRADNAFCVEGQVCDPKVGCFRALGCASDAACDDGLPCNGVEACVDGACRPGEPIACDDGVACTLDACDDDTGRCGALPDHGACLLGELCSLDAGCAPRPPCVRDDDCDDAFFCNGQETCDAPTGLCIGGAVLAVDDGVPCTQDVCSEQLGVVTHTPRPARCQDGQFCNGAELCHPIEGCQAGVPPALSDGVACTDDACDEAADFIRHTPVDVACDDGLFCNGRETCDPFADCRPGEPPRVNDGVGCTVDTCSEVEGRVVHAPDDARCDDGLFCNGTEACDASAGCQAGTAPAVDDGIACTDDACVEARREVVHTPVHARCDDGALCNGAERCDPSLGCQAGAALPVGAVCDADPRSLCFGSVCAQSFCGDGFVDGGATPPETCDGGAGCTPQCTLAAGGGGVRDGLFNFAPPVAYVCEFLGFPLIDIDFRGATFQTVAGQLNVGGFETNGQPVLLVQSPPPAGAMFSVSGRINGGCTEIYTLAGTFSDADHWCGTFTIQLQGAQCGFCTAPAPIAVCGTRG